MKGSAPLGSTIVIIRLFPFCSFTSVDCGDDDDGMGIVSTVAVEALNESSEVEIAGDDDDGMGFCFVSDLALALVLAVAVAVAAGRGLAAGAPVVGVAEGVADGTNMEC